MPLFKFSRRPNVQELKSREDINGLIEALDYQDAHNIRLAAASALGRLGDSRAVNPLMSEPNLSHARHVMEQLDFVLVQDIFQNETGEYADVILPAGSFA